MIDIVKKWDLLQASPCVSIVAEGSVSNKPYYWYILNNLELETSGFKYAYVNCIWVG